MMGSISRCDYEAAKLRWENEEVALNPLVGNIINPPEMLKQTWNNSNFKPGDNNTLESIFHQPNFNTIFPHHDQLKCSTKFMSQNPFDIGIEQNNGVVNEVIKVSSMLPLSNSGEKWRDENMQQDMIKQYNMNEVKVKLNPISSGGKYGEDSSPGLVKKRVIREKNYRRKSLYDEGVSERSGCACQSDTFCRDHQTDFSDSGEERRSKGESFRSHSSARSSRHNQSERRRRDRINEKMKALQKLVPNASKTDKASMLDEVIEYLKQLKSQVRMMNNARSIMPQMMMPLAMQQQLQMSYLARMSMGIGMFDINNLVRNIHNSTLYPFASPLGGTTPSFLSPPFAMPPVVPPVKAPANAFVPNFSDAYKTLLAQQSMNMDFFNKVAALNSRPINHQINQSASQSQPNGQRK